MVTCKTLLLILLYTYNINSCKLNHRVFSCVGEKHTNFPFVNSTIRNKTSRIAIHCTKIHNLTSLVVEDWPHLKLLTLFQNKNFPCNITNVLKTPSLTIYCSNNNIKSCTPPNKMKPIPPKKETSYSYLYAILFFILLPTLISVCSCIAVKTLESIKLLEKKKKYRVANLYI